MDFQAPPPTSAPQSFIPKRASSFGVGQTSDSPVGIFMFIGVIMFLVSAITFGGVLLYSASLQSSIDSGKVDLTTARKQFTSKIASLNEMTRLDLKLKVAQTLLNNHVSILPIFTDLEALTYQTVRFTTFKYVLGEDGKITLKLSGQAKNYADFNNFNNYVPVALQSGRFVTVKNISNVVFSDLNLDQTGNVVFNVSAELSPKYVSYRENRHLQ